MLFSKYFTQTPLECRNNALIRVGLVIYAFLMFATLSYIPEELKYPQIVAYQTIFILIGIGLFGLSYMMVSKANETKASRLTALLIIIALGILLRLLTLRVMKTEPISDFAAPHNFYRYYQEHGPYEEGAWDSKDWYQLYYSRFPAWFTYLRVVMFIYDLLGEHLSYILALNMLMAAGTIALIYAAIPNKKIGLLGAVLFAFNPSMIFYSCITTPDHITAFLFTLAIFFWSDMEQKRKQEIKWFRNKALLLDAFLMMVVCALINFLKPLSVLFLYAFIVYEIASNLPTAIRAKKARETLAFEFAFIAAFLVIISLGKMALFANVKTFLKTEAVDATGFYLLVGYSVDENGIYNSSVGEQIFNDILRKHQNDYILAIPDVNQSAKEQFLSNMNYLPSILEAKFRDAFAGEYGYFGFSNSSSIDGYRDHIVAVFHQPVLNMMLSAMRVLYIMTGLTAVAYLFHKQVDGQVLQILIVICGYILVLVLGGVQSRYKSLIVPLWCMIAPYAVFEISAVCAKFRPKTNLNKAPVETDGNANAKPLQSDIQTVPFSNPIPEITNGENAV